MDLNPKPDGVKGKVLNPEGAFVWRDNPYRAAILMGISLNLKTDRTFYYTDREKFEEFITVLEKLYETDPEFLEALIPYLKLEHGRKSSPMIVLGFLLSKGKKYQYLPKFINPEIIPTPKQMAEALAVFKLLSGKHTIRKVPFRERFRETLEAYDEYTLKKNRLRRRSIKLADLIKVFRPRPKNEHYSRLYKAIIENSSEASLKAQEHITATLSDSNLSYEEKREIVEKNIEKIPFNALIRNLLFLVEGDRVPSEVVEKVKNRLEEILSEISKGNTKVLSKIDPFVFFDLVFSPHWEELKPVAEKFDELLTTFLQNWADRLGTKNKKAAVLLDVSSSMGGWGWKGLDKSTGLARGYKFLAIFRELFDIRHVDFFNHGYIALKKIALPKELIDELNFWQRLTLVKRSVLRNNPRGALKLFAYLVRNIGDVTSGGTALVDAYKMFVKRHPDVDIYIVITDEVTWADSYNPSWALEFLPNREKQKVIIANVDYMPGYRHGGVVIQNPKILRISEPNVGMLGYLEIWTGDINRLVEQIKKKYLHS